MRIFLALAFLVSTNVYASSSLINCKLGNGNSYKLSQNDDGQSYTLEIYGLEKSNTFENRFITGLGVPEELLPNVSFGMTLTFPSTGSCLFPLDPNASRFTCEYAGNVEARFFDLFDKEFAKVTLGSILFEQTTSLVEAERMISGIQKTVSWPRNQVIFYFKKIGNDGGPSLGGTWRNEGYSSDNAGHGACKVNWPTR